MDSAGRIPLSIDGKHDRSTLPSLTGLRFVAAFLVLFAHGVHVICQTGPTKAFYLLGVMCAYLGMTMFFVLSGFVIHYNYGFRFLIRPLGDSLQSFAVARFARLYPMYVVTFLLCLATSPLFDFLPANNYVFSFHLSMTQSWLYLVTHRGVWGNTTRSFFPHGWSISTEIFFYLLYPLLLLSLSRFSRPKSIVTTIAIFIALAFGLLFLMSKVPQFLSERGLLEQWSSDSSAVFTDWLGYASPPVRFLEFCLGCLAAQLYRSIQDRPLSARENSFGIVCSLIAGCALLGLICLTLVFQQNNYLHFVQSNFLFAPSCAALTFCVVRYKTILSWILNFGPIVLLGEASYSIYLLQHFLFGAFAASSPQPVRFLPVCVWVLKLSLVIGLVFATSLGTYRYVEVPARNWIRGLLGSSSRLTHRSRWLIMKILGAMILMPTLFLVLGYSLYSKYQLPLVYCARASARLAQGDIAGSRADVDTALMHDSRNLVALRQHGSLLKSEGKYEEAILVLSAVLKKLPFDIPALQERAGAFQASQRWTQSLEDYTKAILIVPTFPNHYYLRAQVSRKLGQIDNALADCTRALQLNPSYAEVFHLRAQLRESIGDDPGASRDYAAALLINPKLLDAALARARFREKRGKHKGAILDYKRVLAIDPNHAEARSKMTQSAHQSPP